jgi:peptide/nickel transport system substrate-binding protein
MRRAILLLVFAMLSVSFLAACATATPAPEGAGEGTTEGVAPGGEGEQPVTTTARTGAWVDTVVVIEEPNADAGVERLKAGDIDVYAFPISSPGTYEKIVNTEGISYKESYGSFNELTFNPSVCADTAKVNPFAVPRIREAMNWLVDRNYIVSEIMGGLGTARVTAINTASADRGRLAAEIQEMETKYAYDLEKAKQVVTEEMQKLGATMEGDKWMYQGQPVTLLGLIRSEDERKQIGDYFATQLESIGFTVVRDYKTSAEAAPIWQQSDPTECLFNYYTGGWVSTAISRDAGSNFNFYYTPKGLSRPLWQAYTPVQAFADLAQQLNDNNFKTMDERKQMFASALPLSLEDSVRIWLLDRTSVAALRSEMEVASDLSGSIYGTPLWPYTLRRTGEEGGSVTWASASILTEPWNPIAGTNWIYDTALIRATGQSATVPDPNTGLAMPHRIGAAEVTVQEGLPVGKTLDWVTVNFTPTITVPDDAWVDWNAETQKFMTAAEAFTETKTAKMMTKVTYPADLFDTVKWHDGSPLTVADMIMPLIMTFDQAKEASAIYDEAQVPALESFMSTFKGIKITSTDPLTIEYYTDNWQLDAENAIGNLNSLWPYYGYGEARWDAIALGIMAEAKGLAAFSADKATAKEVEQLSYIAGPTLQVLTDQLTEATANYTTTLPYSATLSQFVTPEEAKARYDSMAEWFRRRGHYWVGTGPLFLQRAFPVEGTVILERNPDFPDPSDRWAQFSEPAIPVVTIDGPASITAGEAATFNVDVTFKDEPYAMEDIEAVNYLVFDANNALVTKGAATGVEDGKWTIELDAATLSKMPAGSNRLDVVVVSKLVALPGLAEYQFVTGQ